MRTWPWSRKPSKPDFTIDPEGAAVSVPETKALDHANLGIHIHLNLGAYRSLQTVELFEI